MRNGLGTGLGIGLVLLVCGGTGLVMYKAIGGFPPAPGVASSGTAAPEQPAKTDGAAAGKSVADPADVAASTATLSILQAIRSQGELYKLQHMDCVPDVKTLSNWEFFTRKTDQNGRPNAQGPYGPYMKSMPVNRLNGYSRIAVIDREVGPGDEVNGSGIGFVLDTKLGRWWATDRSGRRVWDEGGRAERPLPEAAMRARMEAAQTPPAAPSESPADRRLAQLRSDLENLRPKIEAYRLQHRNQRPDFRRYPAWEQLTRRTDEAGRISLNESGPRFKRQGNAVIRSFGPYLDAPPTNPLNGQRNILVVEDVLHPGDRVSARNYGWVYSAGDESLWATDAMQQRIVDDAAAASQDFPADRAAARAALQNQVMSLRSQVEMYKLQHGGRLPDLLRLDRWQQLTRQTDDAGNLVPQGTCGPYLTSTPVNPVNRKSRVELTDADPKPGQKAVNATSGFLVNRNTGKLWGVDESGIVILDD